MATPFLDLVIELRKLGGAPKITFPYGDLAFPVTERVVKARKGSHILAYGTAEPDSTRFPSNKLSEQTELTDDAQFVEVYRKYDITPGPPLLGKKETEWGLATTKKQTVVYGTGTPSGSTVADSSVTPLNELQSTLDSSTYDNLPSAWWFAFPIDDDTNITTRVLKRLNVNGTKGGIAYCSQVSISNATIGNPTVLTLSAPLQGIDPSILFADQEWVNIQGDTICIPTINGNWPATIIDATHISINQNVTANLGGSSFGDVRIAAPIYAEIQALNNRQCIEIWSQIDSTTFGVATKTWTAWIQYPWKEVLVGIDCFNNAGTTSTTATGTFTNPCNITWAYGSTFGGEVAIRTKRYTGKTQAQITRSYSIGPPITDDVQLIRTSSGEVIISGGSDDTHHALVIGSTGTQGEESSHGTSVHYQSVRIEDVLTNGFTSGTLASGGALQAGISLYLDPSIPTTFTAATTFIADSTPSPGRLGLFMKEVQVVTVPTPFP